MQYLYWVSFNSFIMSSYKPKITTILLRVWGISSLTHTQAIASDWTKKKILFYETCSSLLSSELLFSWCVSSPKELPNVEENCTIPVCYPDDRLFTLFSFFLYKLILIISCWRKCAINIQLPRKGEKCFNEYSKWNKVMKEFRLRIQVKCVNESSFMNHAFFCLLVPLKLCRSKPPFRAPETIFLRNWFHFRQILSWINI